MARVTGITKRLDVPNEPGQWIEIRMLSWLKLEEAKKARLATIAEQARTFSGIDLTTAAANASQEDLAAAQDRVASYDRMTLLREGLMAWSYTGDVDPADLDEPTAEWAARAILDLSLPDESDTKGPSSRSTGISGAAASHPTSG